MTDFEDVRGLYKVVRITRPEQDYLITLLGVALDDAVKNEDEPGMKELPGMIDHLLRKIRVAR